MNINVNNGLNPYNTNYVSSSQSLTGSVTEDLKKGDVFEGSVNSVENGKVVIGLANGQTMTARLDAGVSITPGQSIFFEVKSNDGNLVQIRPVSINSLDANPTLLKALDMANIAVNQRTINMVNSMMQNSMSVSPESLAAMNRAMINNPEVDLQTLVTMEKYGMELTPENVNMFVNYSNDKAVLADNFQVISDMLPEMMTSEEVSVGQVIQLNNAIKDIFLNQQEANQPVITQAPGETAQGSRQVIQPDGQPQVQLQTQQETVTILQPETANMQEQPETMLAQQPQQQVELAEQAVEQQQQVQSQESVNTTLISFASEKHIDSFNTILNALPDFPKDNLEVFREDGTFKAEADVNEVFREISEYLDKHPDIPKSTLNDIIRQPLYKGILKAVIADSFAMEPKEVAKAGELSKLYERVYKQTEALERLVSAFSGKAAETIKHNTAEIKQNINFMNSANEMYNFVQIPLKMYNQNTDSMLYVRQNKKRSYEEGEEITAFLHFDMEYLGPTDVFITLKETKVGCKWNLANEDSMKLIEDNLDLLTKRLADKGFTCTSSVTCKEDKPTFLHDFLGVPVTDSTDKSEGLVHRYSFDMRA